jgi:iron complex outermembrane recepter protein
MTRHNELVRSIRYALLIAAGISSTAALAQGAEEAKDAKKDIEELAPVTVTGSRIPRSVDSESSQPVLSLTREDIKATGLSQIGDILQNIASAGSALNQTFNNGGNGSTYVDLRDLGSDRTLILVNGRRYAPDGSALSGQVDLNSIPTSIVERIEVLKDGASTIYGSDAIAGVINIITVDSFDGMEASGYFGQNSEGDGTTQAYDYTIGASNDRTSAVVNVSFQKNEPIFAGDRDISAVPQFGADFCASSTAPWGRFGLAGRAGTFTLNNRTATGPGVVQSAANIRPFAIPADCYNFAPDNYLLTPQRRYALFGSVRHNLVEDGSIRFRSELVYNHRSSDQLLAPIPVTFASSGLFGANVRFDVSPLSYYNPFGVATTRVQRRLNETGGRNFVQDVDVFHYSGGVEGYFDIADKPFTWDVGYIFSLNQSNDITKGQTNVNRIATAVGPSFRDATGVIRCGTPTAVIAGCVPLNLFGGNGSITPEMLAYVSTPLQDANEYKRKAYNANIGGELFELPAGALGFAAGYEYRNESGFDLPDALTSSGASSGNIRQPTNGGFSIDELYAEFRVPVLADMPGAKLLEVSLASRYSDYSTFGNTTNSKFGFKWKPIDDLLVRGNWSEGFRAPSISDLFTGQSDNFAGVNDPCTGPGQATANRFATLSPEQRARCLAAGVPANGAEQAAGQIRATVGGNPNLSPETAVSKTFGLVYSPEYLTGFDVSLDWWNIKIENSITTLGAQTIADACILAGATAQCGLITRLPGTGAIVGLLDVNTNGASDDVTGYDFAANYRFETDAYGKFHVGLDSTYFDSYINVTESGIVGQPLVYSFVGNYYGSGGFVARVKSQLSVDWAMADWNASWKMRYTSRMQQNCTAAVDPTLQCSNPDGANFNVDGLGAYEVVPTNQIGGTTYHDVQVSWNAPWEGVIAGGIRNLGDKAPPTAVGATNSFDPSFDVPGRFYYVSYSQKF